MASFGSRARSARPSSVEQRPIVLGAHGRQGRQMAPCNFSRLSTGIRAGTYLAPTLPVQIGPRESPSAIAI